MAVNSSEQRWAFVSIRGNY